MGKRALIISALTAGLAAGLWTQWEGLPTVPTETTNRNGSFGAGWFAAVVDRVEEGRHAVLLVDDPSGEPREREIVVALDKLPKGTKEGMWLQVLFAAGSIVDARLDAEATKAAEERIAAKLERLRQRR